MFYLFIYLFVDSVIENGRWNLKKSRGTLSGNIAYEYASPNSGCNQRQDCIPLKRQASKCDAGHTQENLQATEDDDATLRTWRQIQWLGDAPHGDHLRLSWGTHGQAEGDMALYSLVVPQGWWVRKISKAVLNTRATLNAEIPSAA